MYTPLHLKRWTLPQSYFGAHWDGYYSAIGHHRDSDTVTESNWQVTCAAIPETGEYDPDDPTSGVIIVRENHWAVGWVEWLAIHETCEAALRQADKFAQEIDDYPILDESHFSDLEYAQAAEYWRTMRITERIDYLREAELSIFAARRAELPDDPDGRLFERLTAN